MIYESKLPAMNINSISLAPHAADRAAENQDRRKWVSWMKEIEKKAEKDVMIEFNSSRINTAQCMKSRGNWRSTPRISWLGKSRHGG